MPIINRGEGPQVGEVGEVTPLSGVKSNPRLHPWTVFSRLLVLF